MGIPAKERTAHYRQKRYAEIAMRPQIPCACGCGRLIPPINKQLKPAQYAHGHNPDGQPFRFKKGHKDTRSPEVFKKAIETRRAKGNLNPTKEAIEKRTATRRERNNFHAWNKGIPMRPESKGKLSQSLKGLMVGKANPFYGKNHLPKTKLKISAKLLGLLNPNWAGGTSTLPYGPGFTRRFKKLIRERDDYKCQRCGHKQRKGERALQIHHIDHEKDNNNPTNLITVCGSCNVWLSYHRDISLQVFPKRKMLLN